MTIAKMPIQTPVSERSGRKLTAGAEFNGATMVAAAT
jgi:hypothetical protein